VKSLLVLIVCAAIAGCATVDVEHAVTPGMPASEVSARLGKPIAEGRLPGNETYWDYTREPNGYYRVIFGPDERVREVRNLHTEENFRNLKPGMTPSEVTALIGVPPDYLKQTYANGTKSWTYRYRDVGIAKLLHVIFGPDDRLLWYYWEWDPSVYSKGDSVGKSGGR
jgi:outer membrane protein assembly factor BamE (lipoprotein component of BamABCDE complex)